MLHHKQSDTALFPMYAPKIHHVFVFLQIVEGACELEPCDSDDGNMRMLGFFGESEEVSHHSSCLHPNTCTMVTG